MIKRYNIRPESDFLPLEKGLRVSLETDGEWVRYIDVVSEEVRNNKDDLLRLALEYAKDEDWSRVVSCVNLALAARKTPPEPVVRPTWGRHGQEWEAAPKPLTEDDAYKLAAEYFTQPWYRRVAMEVVRATEHAHGIGVKGQAND